MSVLIEKGRTRRLLFISVCFASIIGLSSVVVVQRWNVAVGIPDQVFVFGDTLVLAVCAEVAMMPIVICAARITPSGSEGIVYASIISVHNISSMTSEALGGWLTHALGVTSDDFTNLTKLIVICSLTTLIPLPFISLIPELDGDDYEQIPKEESEMTHIEPIKTLQ